MTSPVVHETSPAPLPVEPDPFLEDPARGTATLVAGAAAPAGSRRRILD